MTLNLRKEWFVYVAKIRKRMSRQQKKPVSHRAAMTAAAESWQIEKVKLQNKAKREARKAAKATVDGGRDKSTENTTEPAVSPQ